jgi:hypothetical protein
MGADFQALGEHRKLFADWTDRIAKGEAPRIAPPSPFRRERNLVITDRGRGRCFDGRADNAARRMCATAESTRTGWSLSFPGDRRTEHSRSRPAYRDDR